MLDADRMRYLLSHEWRSCLDDWRFSYREFASSSSIVPVVDIEDVNLLSTQYQEWLGLGSIQGPVRLIGGGIAHFSSFFGSVETSDRARAESVTKLIHEAVREAQSRGFMACSPLVSAADLPIFAAPKLDFSIVSGPDHYVLYRERGQTVSEFVESLDGAKRKVWRRDERTTRAARLKFETRPFRDIDCDAVGSMVALSAARRGSPDHPLLASWRLRSMARREGQHFTGSITRDGEVVGSLITTRFADVLEVHTFGSAVADDLGRSVYQSSFGLALALATEFDCEQVWFGLEKRWPKVTRGCIVEPRQCVIYGLQRSSLL